MCQNKGPRNLVRIFICQAQNPWFDLRSKPALDFFPFLQAHDDK